jgi:hypothetical protein
MFYGCSKLTSAAAITFNDATNGCCQYMFQNCTSLTTAPDLLCVWSYYMCYYYMFNGCSKLNYIKMMAIDLYSDCTYGWVTNVASTGTFVKHKDATWNITGNSGVPAGWTVVYDG